MVMVWVQLVRRISQQNVQENEGNSFYFRKMYGVVNLVGPEVQPSIGNVKHGPLRLPISIDGARMMYKSPMRNEDLYEKSRPTIESVLNNNNKRWLHRKDTRAQDLFVGFCYGVQAHGACGQLPRTDQKERLFVFDVPF